jgi:tetratricopeptide (TPR) repeat protein
MSYRECLKSLAVSLLLILCFYNAAAQDKDAKYYTERGDDFFAKQKYKDAILSYSAAISKDDKYAVAYAYRGYAYVADFNQNQEAYIKQLNKAIQDCSFAISLRPDSSNFYYYRAQAYNRKKLADSAILDLTKAISLETDTSAINYRSLVDFYESRADIYQQKKMYYETIVDYTQLISMDSTRADIYRNRCKAYFYTNQIDSAIKDIAHVFRIDSANYMNNNYRGLCYNSLGEYELSILDFLTYILKVPDHGNPYINIISPLVRLKRFSEAALFYNLYSEKKLYKEINAKFGDKKFDSFLNLDKYKFYNYYLKAVTQVAESKWNDAIASLDTASKVYGTEPKDDTKRLYVDVLSLSGFVLEKLERYEDAKASYQQSLVIDPRQPDLGEALVDLQKKQTLTRSLNKKKAEIEIKTANVQKQTRGFTIEADSNVLKVSLIGEVKDDAGIDSLKINGFAAYVNGSTFFANLTLKPDVSSLLITAFNTQKDSTTKTFDLNELTNNKFSGSLNPKAVDTEAGKYYAVLIAEKDYADPSIPDLRTPIRDANNLREILINQYTFDSTNVDTLYNRSREDIIETIIARCKKMTDKDNLLVFYAGHGDTTIDKKGKIDGYLVPSSARNDLTSYYITSEDIFKALLRSNAKHILILLDACYSGTFTRKTSPDVPNDIKKQYELESRKIMSSGNIEEVPDNSEFIYYLTEYLKKNTQERYVSAKDLWEDVSKKVKSTLAQYAALDEAGDFGGQFIFEKRTK